MYRFSCRISELLGAAGASRSTSFRSWDRCWRLSQIFPGPPLSHQRIKLVFGRSWRHEIQTFGSSHPFYLGRLSWSLGLRLRLFLGEPLVNSRLLQGVHELSLLVQLFIILLLLLGSSLALAAARHLLDPAFDFLASSLLLAKLAFVPLLGHHSLEPLAFQLPWGLHPVSLLHRLLIMLRSKLEKHSLNLVAR